MSVSLLLAFLARSPRLQLLEEVVALVIYEDECREVLYGNLPDSLHTELWVLYALDALDRTLSLLNKYKIKANIIRHKNYFPIFVGYYSII